MKLKPVKRIPILIAVVVLAIVCLLRIIQYDPIERVERKSGTGQIAQFRDWLKLDFFERLERMTYDMRVREALKFSPAIATNLGFVAIDEDSIKAVHDGRVGNQPLGYRFGLYWPRQVYGRLIQELAGQGAKAIAFDVMFGELRMDHSPVVLVGGGTIDSDLYFAHEMAQATNVIIAITEGMDLPALFRTNAAAIGDIGTDKDAPDGILRRARAFRTYRYWHPAFQQVAADPDYAVDLAKVKITPNELVLLRDPALGDISIPLDSNGEFELAALGEPPPGTPPKAKPFKDERVWHMGVVLAAQALGLDLAKADVDLERGRITLTGAGGLKRVIPVDSEGYFYIDWCLPPDSHFLATQAVEDLLKQNRMRLEDKTNELSNLWKDKLVVVGSSARGNDLTDRGATPLKPNTLFVSKHWNVANSIITGRFVQRAPVWLELMLIIVLGILAAALTWELRVLLASLLVIGLAVGYVTIGVTLFVHTRYWIPLVLPVIGALLMTHVSLVTWRVVFEQAEQRRVRSIFSKVVSPKIVTELLGAETLALGGARRQITVMFADVRGFTELTDTSQERVAEFVRQKNLSGAEAEVHYDEQARETLHTVNLYLGLIADIIKGQDGTLDKFIGDCVMAFWGAPAPNPKHALGCVRAAIQAQRAIFQLNQRRTEENHQREQENIRRQASNQEPLPLLPVLQMGTGINTGPATAGLMGSASAESNYTVFGREVNLASRLEGASGRGRIFIGETTYEHIRRDDPELAATCVPLQPIAVKGFRTAVKVFEVPWRSTESSTPTVQPTKATETV